MFKRLVLAVSLVVGGLAVQAPAASAAPAARTPIALVDAVKSSVEYAQYYYGPRRRYVPRRYYAPPRYYARPRYYGRPYYRGRYAPRRYYPPRPVYRARPYYQRRIYYR